MERTPVGAQEKKRDFLAGMVAMATSGLGVVDWDDIRSYNATGAEQKVTITISQEVVSMGALVTVPLIPASIAGKYQELLQGVVGVEAVLVDEDPEGFSVFTVVDGVPYGERDAIHDAELSLMDFYPHALFEFRVVDRRGSPLPTVLSVDTFDAYLRTPTGAHAH